MAKIMEITSIKKDFKNNKAQLELSDTSFSSFSKVFKSVPGQTVDNLASGQYLGYEAAHDLYAKQKAVFDKLVAAKATINAWSTANSNLYGRGTVPAFSPGLSLEDYTADFFEGTPANWRALTTLINPELTLYKYTKYFETHFLTVQNYLKEWSKNRNYGSTTQSVLGFFESNSDSQPRAFSSTVPGVTFSNNTSSDKVTVTVSGLNNIPDGVTCKITIYAYHDSNPFDDRDGKDQYGYMYIKRNVIDNDSYLTCWAEKGSLADNGYISGYVRTGASATHFDATTPTWAWLNSRFLNI